MIKLSIRHNFPEVAARLDRLPTDIANRAMVRSLNATIEQGKTEMSRKISREFRLSVSKVKERLEVRKASSRGGVFRLEAMLEATRRGEGRSMNMIAFVTGKPVSTSAAKRAGDAGLAGQLQFQIKRTGGRKVIKGAFIGNKDRTVFIRMGRARLPIKALDTIDVPQMFNTRRINEVVRQVMLRRFSANFSRELRVVLGGWAK